MTRVPPLLAPFGSSSRGVALIRSGEIIHFTESYSENGTTLELICAVWRRKASFLTDAPSKERDEIRTQRVVALTRLLLTFIRQKKAECNSRFCSASFVNMPLSIIPARLSD